MKTFNDTASPDHPAGQRRRKNVLFITCDQWRGDCLSAAGHPVVRTPNADALAADGVLFKRHYAGAAPCSPARACLYTGLYQMNNRVCRNGTPLSARHVNIAQIARTLGYDPTLFGYTDVSLDPNCHHPNDPVLHSYEGVLPGFTIGQFLPEHQKPWLTWLASRGVDAGAGYPDIHRPADKTSPEVSRAPPIYSSEETPAAFIVGEFGRWLGEQERDRPWFAHLSLISPHPPFVAPAPFNSMYDPDGGPDYLRHQDWETEALSHPWLKYRLEGQDKDNFIVGAQGKVHEWDEAAFRTIRAIYYGMISEVDAQLGRLWQSLRDMHAWDDTVVVLTSDHAEMMGDHFMLGKGGYHDQSYHVPLIVRDPERSPAAGMLVDRFTEAVDIAPTLIEAMGGEVPAHFDGRSLAPFLSGATPENWREEAHWEFDFRSIASGNAERHFGLRSQQCNLAVLRSDTLKYVHFGGGLPPLLFDLQDDPGELRDRSNDPAYLAARLDMAERMLRWRGEHLDQSLALVELTGSGAVIRKPGDETPAPFPARAF